MMTKDYFDFNQIETHLNIANLIITETEIPLDHKNDNIIFSLNWLTKNCKTIYEGYYSKFAISIRIDEGIFTNLL